MCLHSALGQGHVIWQLGNSDGSSGEFSLAPNGYKQFLEHDFGYEDNAFIIGQSSLANDLPYVLPGPANGWGGDRRNFWPENTFFKSILCVKWQHSR